ncbi:MAG TPA: tryptophan synthase subunit alpha [Bacillota bacterium]|uniref:tryptophan synthase subunit alpha n=1 Tax=Kineothrix sp. MB12-C1 TaxID=3070215 RepID=UPI0027D2143B|nr:tryptophan synthase subunit alpha [Kineothrix sp. MB12-C1]WMC91991.1 tryptophan synthase subunit alpha [Kineothrix sp. MB12-C1]HOO61992.1 tryptophan synthase subunit alpha [Bacillota bacterium]
MSKIKIRDAFAHGKAFIGFLTGGDPSIEKSEEFILKMVEAGCDLIEIGIPFSDPVAEGPVIQEANLRALAADTTTDKIFELAQNVRKKTDVPLVFLTYLNPVYKYGYERFCQRCEEIGVNGLIIPDMPYEEKEELLEIGRKYDVDIISLIAPTSEERVRMIAKDAKGFLYIVSSMGVTGMRSEIKTDLEAILTSVKEVTDTPAAVGFGVNTPEQAKKIARIADGVIVGSAIVKIIEKYGEEAGEHIYDYVKSMKDAIQKIEL